MHGITRIAASLRDGVWDDRSARVLPAHLEQLSAVINEFGPRAIYGEEFLDSADDWVERWGDRLSLDWRPTDDAAEHTFDFFQEGSEQHLDVRIWFDDLQVLDDKGIELSLGELVDAADRWWGAMRRRDSRTAESGIVPLE